MKKFRFLSSLTLASVILSGTALAAETTKMHGEYNNGELRTLKTPAVAFSLTDNTDRLTVDEILSLGGYKSVKLNGSTVDGATEVKTGDYITTDGTSEKKDVVIYGDVDGNKEVSVEDVVYASEMSAGVTPEGTTVVQKEAADVENNGEITIEDVVRISEFSAGIEGVEAAINVPEPEEKPPVEESQFTVELKDQYVNNQNETHVEGMLNINPQLEEAMTNVKFYLVKEDGTLDANALYTISNVPAYTSKIAIKDTDRFNLSSLPEGVNTIKIIEGSSTTGKVLGEFTVEKHTDEIDAAKIVGAKGTRPGSTGDTAGSVSFDIQSESKIVEAYYVAQKTATAPATTAFKDGNGNYTGVISVTDNKVTNAPIKLDISDQEYYVYFLLKDEYGSVSTAVCNGASHEEYALIPKGTYTENAKTVTKVEMPNLDDETKTDEANVTITTAEAMSTTDKFQAVLYKDGKPIAETEVTGANGGKTVQVSLDTFSPTVKDAGEYYVEVFGKGDATTAPSGTTKSNVVTVSPIASVSDVEYTRYSVDGADHTKLSWKTPHNKLDMDNPGYEVYVSNYDQTAKAYKDFKDTSAVTEVSSSQTYNTEDNSIVEIIDPSEITENTLYKAQVVALAKSGHKLSEANSLPTVSKEFFKLETPVVVSNKATSSEATLEITSISSTNKKDNTISGKVPTYAVEVYTKNPNYTASAKTEPEYIRASQYDQAVEVNKSSGRFTVTGLDGNTDYAIKLVATVDGEDGKVKGESAFVALGTKKAMIDITDKVVTSDTDTRGGKIHVNGSTVSIDGVDYNTTEYVELAKVAAIVDELADGDHVTYSAETPDEIAIVISTTDQSGTPRKLPAEAIDMVVNITANSYDQAIETTTGSEPAEINITGQESGSIDITKAKAKDNRIVINNAKVKVAENQEVVIAEGSTVEFDNYYTATASKETPVKVSSANSAGNIQITRTDDNVNADITVKDVKLNKGLNVTYAGTGKIEGTLTLEVTNGRVNDVKVTSGTLTEVASDITVNVKDGTVTINDAKITGHQNVTVTYSQPNKVVNAFAKEVAPFDMTNLEIKQYDYNDKTPITGDYDKLKAAIPSIVVPTDKNGGSVEDVDATKANFDLVNRYLASFGLTTTDNNGKSVAKAGAKITVNKETQSVIITFTGDTKDAKQVAQPLTIKGLR